MNKKLHFIYLFLGGVMLAGVTACSGSDDDEPAKTDDGVKVRRLTITETEVAAEARALVGHASKRASNDADATLGKAGRSFSGNDVAHYVTRALLTEGDNLTASWKLGDVLTYCILSRVNYGNDDAPYSGPLTAASTATISQFTGDVACSGGDYLAVVYPATTFETNESYTISLTGQDGTLEGLATNYHYVYGRANVTEVTDKTANATMLKMKSLLTVCKFSFIDKATNLPIPIQTLTISYGGSGSDAGKYPQTATVAIIENNDILSQADVHAEGVAGNSPLLLEGLRDASEVYVALLPTAAQRTYNFTVTDTSDNTYTGTAKATLVEGEYVAATGLKLTKQP